MRFALFLLIATPAFAEPHSGTASPRSAPELSDVALFAMAAGGVYLVRRAMRVRFAKRRAAAAKD